MMNNLINKMKKKNKRNRKKDDVGSCFRYDSTVKWKWKWIGYIYTISQSVLDIRNRKKPKNKFNFIK